MESGIHPPVPLQPETTHVNSFQELKQLAKETKSENMKKLAEERVQKKEARAKEREQRREARKQRWENVRNGIKNGLAEIKNTPDHIRSFYDTISNPPVRTEAVRLTREAMATSALNLKQNVNELIEFAGDTKDAAIHKSQETLTAVRTSVNENVIRPAVQRSQEIGINYANAAEKGRLFVESKVNAGVQTTGEVIHTVKEMPGKAKERALNWGMRLGSYFSEKGTRLKNEMNERKENIGAIRRELRAAPAGLSERLKLKLAEKLTESAMKSGEIRFDNLFDAAEIRTQSAAWRNSGETPKA